jgi:hypothetical protein
VPVCCRPCHCAYNLGPLTAAVVTHYGHVFTLSDGVGLLWRRFWRNNFGLSSFFLQFPIATVRFPSSANEFPILLSGVTDQPPFMVWRVVLQHDLLAKPPSQVRAFKLFAPSTISCPIILRSPIFNCFPVLLDFVRHWHADRREYAMCGSRQVVGDSHVDIQGITRSPPPSEALGPWTASLVTAMGFLSSSYCPIGSSGRIRSVLPVTDNDGDPRQFPIRAGPSPSYSDVKVRAARAAVLIRYFECVRHHPLSSTHQRFCSVLPREFKLNTVSLPPITHPSGPKTVNLRLPMTFLSSPPFSARLAFRLRTSETGPMNANVQSTHPRQFIRYHTTTSCIIPRNVDTDSVTNQLTDPTN